MILIVVIGNTGTGKTTFLKDMVLKNKQLGIKSVAFDVNDEYKDVADVTFFDKDELLNFVEKRKNIQIIIDEATAFFSYRSFDNNFNRLLQLKRHKNHLFILCYHSLRFVPQYVRMYMNYLIAFNTNDSEEEFKKLNLFKPNLNKFEHKIFKII